MKTTSGLRSRSLALTALVALALACPARATIIGFESAPRGSGFTGPVTEGSFTYQRVGGSLYVDSHGNPGQDMEGLAGRGGGMLKITANTGGQFTYGGLDFTLYSGSTENETLVVTGYLGGSQVGTASYTLTGNGSSYTPYASEGAGALALAPVDNLQISLSANASGGSVYFFEGIDNVVVNPIPEPGTWALLGVGAPGLAAALRRRRATAPRA